MTNKNYDSHKNVYFLPIKTINGIKFTSREIDIMACILGRRTAKKVAFSLQISPKTVENHTRNIMQKLGCNSREGIIDFIEGSPESPLLKQRYAQLLCAAAFEQALKEISAQIKGHILHHCTIIDGSADVQSSLLSPQLQQYLESVGIRSTLKTGTLLKELSALKKDIDTCGENNLLYILPQSLQKEIKISANFIHEASKESNDPHHIPVLMFNKNIKKVSVVGFPRKNPQTVQEFIIYYGAVFNMLGRFLPTLQLDEIVSRLKHRCDGGTHISLSEITIPKEKSCSQKHQRETMISLFTTSILKWKIPIAAVFSFLICCAAGFITFKNGDHLITQEGSLTRSELALPAKYTLLDRPALIAEISKKLNAQEEIQTIALVGLAGTGKKVLARQYAKQQRGTVIWEINSERLETILGSFERLAYALAKSEKEKQTVDAFQEIRSPEEREQHLVLFVKERLRLYPNWILIFYNVDNFSNIQNFFPTDISWGQGQVLITTTDSNIQDNKYVNQVVEVSELNENQALELFLKILSKNSSKQPTISQIKEAKNFLRQIPPFPLDIAIAAYYIKETQTSYKSYIELLSSHDNNFETLQEDVLKEIGEYAKTRYHIVSLSLKKLIAAHPDYKDLFLSLSLLDSKYVPNNLLYLYKDKITVDHFIHDLKKYSITIFTLHDMRTTDPTFSTHRSIQKYIFDYLKKDLIPSEYQKKVHLIATAMEQYLDTIIYTENISKMQLMLGHCLQLIKHDQVLPLIIKGRICIKIGIIYYHIGNLLKSKQALSTGLDILHVHQDSNSPVLAVGLAWLGSIHREFGQFEQAKKFLEQSLIIHKQQLSNDYNGMAFVLRHLARVYRNLNEYEKAKSLIEESLEVYRNNSLAQPIQIARSQVCLGKVYKDLGNYTAAKNLLQKAYAISIKYYGQEHPRVARILRDLGQVYYLEGDFVKGKELTQAALEIFQKYEHPERYTTFENLAELHLKMVAQDAATFPQSEQHNLKGQIIDYLNQALKILQAYFPPDSYHITRIQSKIAKLKENQA